jgi:hypothetical protein
MAEWGTNRDPVYLLVAGSLLTAMERGMKNEIKIPLRVEAPWFGGPLLNWLKMD